MGGKYGRAQSEHLSSGPPLEADMAQSSRHLKVQHSEVVASFDHVVSEPQQIG